MTNGQRVGGSHFVLNAHCGTQQSPIPGPAVHHIASVAQQPTARIPTNSREATPYGGSIPGAQPPRLTQGQARRWPAEGSLSADDQCSADQSRKDNSRVGPGPGGGPPQEVNRKGDHFGAAAGGLQYAALQNKCTHERPAPCRQRAQLLEYVIPARFPIGCCLGFLSSAVTSNRHVKETELICSNARGADSSTISLYAGAA